MGSRPTPHYADIFMADIDQIIEDVSIYNLKDIKALQILKRFLDDYIGLFVGSRKKLHELLEQINKINQTIQLTMKHTSMHNEPEEDRCHCIETNHIPFHDTLISIKKGKIYIDLYKKEINRIQYLLPTSCHCKNTTKAIPYSL